MSSVNRHARRLGRRTILAAGSAVVTGCFSAPAAQSNAAQTRPVMAELPAPAPQVAAPPPVVEVAPVAPAPAPRPSLIELGVEPIVQPCGAGEGDRVLFYDQPAPGQGGTWRVDPATGKIERERPQWGSYMARGTLLVTPRPAQRDTHVLHLPSGREWTLATTNGATFSPDGSMVTHSAAAAAQPGQPAPGGQGNFSTTTLMVSWA